MAYDLHHLKAFATIVKAGSLGQAAALLHITQPALSRTIKRLETQAGVALFERHAKGMQLTEFGRVLLPHATFLLRESERAEEDINALRGLSKGTIRVGAVASLVGQTLPRAISQVLQQWPGLRVQVVEGIWDELSQALVKHEIDLALGGAAPDTEDIIGVRECRWEDSTQLVAALDHPLRQRADLQLADLMQQRWAITPKGTAPYETLAGLFAAQGLGLPEIAVETSSIIMLKNLVMQAGFLSWFPQSMYGLERQAGLIDALPVPGTQGSRSLTLFRRRLGILPGPAVKLLEELRRLTRSPASPFGPMT